MPIATRNELTAIELLNELPWTSPDTIVHISIGELKALLEHGSTTPFMPIVDVSVEDYRQQFEMTPETAEGLLDSTENNS